MFPLPWNFPFIKKNGVRTTIGAALDNAGTTYTLPTASADTKGGVKIGSGLTMDGEALNANAQLPTYTSSEEGKVLSVDSSGDLEWITLASGAKIYYKDYNNISWTGSVRLAKWDSGAAAESDYRMAKCSGSYGNNNVTISGYRAIAAIARDKYSGYALSASLEYIIDQNDVVDLVSLAYAARDIDTGALGVRVFYVKSEDLIEITS